MRELLLWWTQVITKLKLWKTQIATTQIVFKIQIVTKLSIKQHLNNEPSNFKQIPKNLKLQNTWPTKDGNIDTRLLGRDDGPAIQLPGGLDLEEDGPGSTHYQMRVSAGGTWQGQTSCSTIQNNCGCVIKVYTITTFKIYM